MLEQIKLHRFLSTKIMQAAWKTISSWYIVAQQDQALNPNLQRFFARRIGAKTSEIKSSHVPFISHPAEVARLIEQAATAAEK
jgi:pimeloyl-ACP methyl ester carboxylesterase